MVETQKEVLKRAAEAAGGFPALALKLGISRHALYQWDRIPADRVIELEAATGISRTELRPDLFEGFAPAKTEAA